MKKQLATGVTWLILASSGAYATTEKEALAWRFEIGTLSNKALSPLTLQAAVGAKRGAMRGQLEQLENKATRVFNKTPAAEPCKKYAAFTVSLFDATFAARDGNPHGVAEVADMGLLAGEWRHACEAEIDKFK